MQVSLTGAVGQKLVLKILYPEGVFFSTRFLRLCHCEWAVIGV